MCLKPVWHIFLIRKNLCVQDPSNASTKEGKLYPELIECKHFLFIVYSLIIYAGIMIVSGEFLV